MALSFAQLQALWIQAGGNIAAAPVAAAVALAESSGDPSNTNPIDNNGTQTSWGLWQISDGTHDAPAGWSDPLTNARMAVAKYNAAGQSFARDWGTYSSGAYKQYLPAASTVSGAVAGFVVGDTTGSGATTVYGQTLGPQQTLAHQATSVNTGAAGATPGFFGPVIDAANSIATEVFLGAAALALLSGGILWLASTDSSIRGAAAKAAA